MTVYEEEVLRQMAEGLRAEAMNWIVGGGTLIVLLLAVVGFCTVVKAVTAR